MCEFTTNFNFIQKFISENSNFSLSDIIDELNRSGVKIMRIGPSYTIKEYLTDLVIDGVLKYNPEENKYYRKEEDYKPVYINTGEELNDD